MTGPALRRYLGTLLPHCRHGTHKVAPVCSLSSPLVGPPHGHPPLPVRITTSFPKPVIVPVRVYRSRCWNFTFFSLLQSYLQNDSFAANRIFLRRPLFDVLDANIKSSSRPDHGEPFSRLAPPPVPDSRSQSGRRSGTAKSAASILASSQQLALSPLSAQLPILARSAVFDPPRPLRPCDYAADHLRGYHLHMQCSVLTIT